MLSRLSSLRCLYHPVSSTMVNTQSSARNIAFSVPRFGRYTRDGLRERLHRQKNSFKDTASNPANTIHPDSIPVRPPSHLLRALGFTVVAGASCFAFAAVVESERAKKVRQRLKDPMSFFVDMERFFRGDPDAIVPAAQAQSPRDVRQMLGNMSRAQTCVVAITGVNVLVTLLWRYKPLQAVMYRYFTNSFASKSMYAPMFLSTFSHKLPLHLVLNMYVLWTFAPATITRFLGVEQFLAFYFTGGLVSSLISLVHKSAISSPIRALGASGAILALLIYACMKMPEARLRIIFLPFFDFSAENAVYGIILFDFIGLVLGWRVFDHAAHLGGSLFGLWYAKYGENYYKTRLLPSAIKIRQDQEREMEQEKRKRKITKKKSE